MSKRINIFNSKTTDKKKIIIINDTFLLTDNIIIKQSFFKINWLKYCKTLVDIIFFIINTILSTQHFTRTISVFWQKKNNDEQC